MMTQAVIRILHENITFLLSQIIFVETMTCYCSMLCELLKWYVFYLLSSFSYFPAFTFSNNYKTELHSR